MGNINTTESIKKGLNEAAMDALTKRTGEALAQGPLVMVRIPKIEGTEDQTVECCVNGYNYVIKRGENVLIPAPVASLLENAGIL